MSKPSCTVEVEFTAPDPEAVVAALEPDNKTAPPDISVECHTSSVKVLCRVTVEPCMGSKQLLRLRNTVDDLLQAAKAAIEAIAKTRE